MFGKQRTALGNGRGGGDANSVPPHLQFMTAHLRALHAPWYTIHAAALSQRAPLHCMPHMHEALPPMQLHSIPFVPISKLETGFCCRVCLWTPLAADGEQELMVMSQIQL